MTLVDNFFDTTFDLDSEKQKIIDFIDMKKNQDSAEAVFFDKYHEIQSCIGEQFVAGLMNQIIGGLTKGLGPLMGGVSKIMAAGGLRFGYALCSSKKTAHYFDQMNTFRPHFTCLYSARKIYKKLNDLQPSLVAFLAEQRSLLRKRSEILSKVLNLLFL